MTTTIVKNASGWLVVGTSAPGALSVTGTDGLSPSGEEGGGSYLPSSVVYTLTNTGTTPINWTATKTAAWVSLSSASGTLAAGASTTVTVSVVAATIDALADGAYSDTVTFTNTTNGRGDTTRTISLTVTAAVGGGSEATSITQYGITWDLDDNYEVGQYANGDWWVVGPCVVTAITKPLATDGRDGSMVNPSGNSNGYDSRIGSGSGAPAYSSSLDVSRALPLALSPGQSLCSCLSHSALSGSPNNDAYLKAFAVLTCVASAPAATAMRPNFNHSTKYNFDTTDIDTGLLPSLSVVGTPTTMAKLLAATTRPWPDHIYEYFSRMMHASDNYSAGGSLQYRTNGCVTYGRDFGTLLGEAMLMCCCNPATVGDRTALIISMVQKGIDMYGAVKGGGKWPGSGGHGQGRKAPILFAGHLLGDAGMLAIGTDYPATTTGVFGEDMQTFTVSAADVSRTLLMEVTANVTSATSTTATCTLNQALNGYALLVGGQPTVGGVKPGGAYIEVTAGTGIGQRRRLVNCSQVRGTTLAVGASITFTVNTAWTTPLDATSVISTIGYETADIGVHEWGDLYSQNPARANPAIGSDYRSSENAPAWVGAHLVMVALGLQTEWAHDSFFGYMDRWMSITAVGGTSELQPTYRSWSTWAGAMWDAHRGSYP